MEAKIARISEELDNEVVALQALSGLCSGCFDADRVNITKLAYLLDPIIERQRELVDQLQVLGYQKSDAPGSETPPQRMVKQSADGARVVLSVPPDAVKNPDETLAAFFARVGQIEE